MQRHLFRCLVDRKMAMFPHTKTRRGGHVHSSEEIELYCTCRMPEVPPMVECTEYKLWYHVDCVTVPKEALENSNVVSSRINASLATAGGVF